MIRTRLVLVFALMALLALGHAAFTLGAIHTSVRSAERLVVAKAQLNQYLELSANKQRLKVWRAQDELGDAPAVAERDRLLAAMSRSIALLGDLSERHEALGPADDAVPPQASRSLHALLADHLAALQQALLHPGAVRPTALTEPGPPVDWDRLTRVFDQTQGRDLRSVLDEAVNAQRAHTRGLEDSLSQQLRWVAASTGAWVILTLLLSAAAVAYLVRRLHRPFEAHAQAIEAIAAGNLAPTAVPANADEFQALALRLNMLSARLAAVRLSEEADRMRLEHAVADRTRELTASQARLQAIDAQRRRFFAQVGHELRTPLTVMQGEADLGLRAKAYSVDDHREALRRIRAVVQQLAGRVEDLMLAARSEPDALPHAMAVEPVQPVIERVLAQARTLARDRHQTVTFESGPQGLQAHWDGRRIEQALMVLLDNALRYSPPGAEVGLSVRHRPAPGPVDGPGAAGREPTLEITVTDAGIGIGEGERERVFEPWFRGSKARALQPGGSGLGLSVALAIVQAHGGQLSLDPRQPGPGLVARVSLPLPTPSPLPAPER